MVWLYSDEYGEPEHVVRFVLRCAEMFGLHGLWGFTWALTCSKPRLEAFGGGAHLLDLGRRETLGWIDCATWLGERTRGVAARAVADADAAEEEAP